MSAKQSIFRKEIGGHYDTFVCFCKGLYIILAVQLLFTTFSTFFFVFEDKVRQADFKSDCF